MSDDALHAYYTTNQTTFPYKEQMDWHVANKSEDGVMKGHVDSKT